MHDAIESAYESPFPFLMVPDAIWRMKISHDAIIVYLRLIHHTNRASFEAWPSRRSMAEAVFPGLSWERARKRLDVAIGELVNLRMLRKEARTRPDGSQASNRFVLTRESAWDADQRGGGGSPDDPGGGSRGNPGGGRVATPLEPDPTNQIQPNQGTGSGSSSRDADASVARARPVPSQAAPANSPQSGAETAVEKKRPKTASSARLNPEPDVRTPDVLPALRKPLPASVGPSPEKGPTPGTQVWTAYADAYERRYGVQPAKNRDTARHAKALAESMSLDEAIGVAAFYLTTNVAWYVSKAHDIRWAAQDANGLRTQMLTGRKITHSQAQSTDRMSAGMDAAARVAAKYAALEAAGENE